MNSIALAHYVGFGIARIFTIYGSNEAHDVLTRVALRSNKVRRHHAMILFHIIYTPHHKGNSFCRAFLLQHILNNSKTSQELGIYSNLEYRLWVYAECTSWDIMEYWTVSCLDIVLCKDPLAFRWFRNTRLCILQPYQNITKCWIDNLICTHHFGGNTRFSHSLIVLSDPWHHICISTYFVTGYLYQHPQWI